MTEYQKIVLREKDGKINSHTRLNTYSWFVNNIRFLDKDLPHNSQYTSKKQLAYEGAEEGRIVPINEGILVLDQLKDKVHHLNSVSPVSSFGFISFRCIAYEIGCFPSLEKWVEFVEKASDSESGSIRLKELLTRGKIPNIGLWDSRLQRYVPELPIIAEEHLEDLGRSVTEAQRLTDSRAFLLDISPYKLREYKISEMESMISELEKDDFCLNAKDKKLWMKWLQDF